MTFPPSSGVTFCTTPSIGVLSCFVIQVYQDYIHDRHHTHMNSTQWETLTDFVKWLGKEGHCVVDETEKGWFIQYIDRDPEAIRRQEAVNKKEKMDLDDEERRARFIQQQIERTKHADGDSGDNTTVYTELQRETDEEKVAFKLPIGLPSKKKTSQLSSSEAFKDIDKKASVIQVKADDVRGAPAPKRKSALEEIREWEEAKKRKLKESSTVSH